MKNEIRYSAEQILQQWIDSTVQEFNVEQQKFIVKMMKIYAKEKVNETIEIAKTELEKIKDPI